jgi:chromosome segregation ATPase
MRGSELSVDHSFTSASSSAPSLDANKETSSNPVPATNTDFPLSLSSSSDVSVPSQDKNSNVEAKDAISKINCSYGEDPKAWIPQGRQAELVSILVQRQREMQACMQDSTAWAQDKVVRVTRHLAKEKEELQSLRKEKEELDRLQEEGRTLEESTRKKILEMESAISRTNAHLEKVNASARRRDAENAQLRIQLDAAKRHEVESSTKFGELSRKNEETLKRSQYCESERAVLQDELAAEKNKLSRVLQQLQHAKEKEDQVQVIAIFCLPIHNIHIKLTIFHEKHRGSNPMNQDQSVIYGSCLI